LDLGGGPGISMQRSASRESATHWRGIRCRRTQLLVSCERVRRYGAKATTVRHQRTIGQAKMNDLETKSDEHHLFGVALARAGTDTRP